MKIFLFRIPVMTVLMLLAVQSASSQHRMTPEAYIDRYKNIAIAQMRKYGIPASITLAQGGLESGWGSSELAVNANNHFGIKCHSWSGPTYRKDAELPKECFRKYSTPEESYSDHSKFLRYRERYTFLFSLAATDYVGWANGLLSAGYATNPLYAERLINLINKYELYRYDSPGGGAGKDKSVAEGHSAISINNGVEFVIAGSDQTYADIAKEHHIYRADLARYNDLRRASGAPDAGSRIYLQRKKSRAQKHKDIHIAAEGDTYHSISQQYGVRLKCIYRYNYAGEGIQPSPGDTVCLRRKKKR